LLLATAAVPPAAVPHPPPDAPPPPRAAMPTPMSAVDGVPPAGVIGSRTGASWSRPIARQVFPVSIYPKNCEHTYRGVAEIF